MAEFNIDHYEISICVEDSSTEEKISGTIKPKLYPVSQRSNHFQVLFISVFHYFRILLWVHIHDILIIVVKDLNEANDATCTVVLKQASAQELPIFRKWLLEKLEFQKLASSTKIAIVNFFHIIKLIF